MSIRVSYEVVSPAVLATIVEKEFEVLCTWRDINEDYFTLVVFDDINREQLQKIIERF